NLFAFLNNVTGKEISDIFDAEWIYEFLKEEELFGYKLPDWLNETIYLQLYDVAVHTFYFQYSTHLSQRLRAGLLLKEIRRKFRVAGKIEHESDKKIEENNRNETFFKLNIFSTHDANLAALMSALQVFSMKVPPYGSCLIFELHLEFNELIVKSFYLNETETENPIALKLFGMEQRLKFSVFEEKISEIIPNDWRQDLDIDYISCLPCLTAIHRHGDRTPIISYPKDPYADTSNWPDGWGQLTMTEPRIVDGMLNPSSHCPTAEKESRRVRSSPEVLNFQESYKDLFDYLTLNTGRNVTDMFIAEQIHDCLLIEKENGFELPPWVNHKVLTQLIKITANSFYFDFSTKLLHRLRAGLILKDIRRRFKDISADPLKKSSSYLEENSHPNTVKKLFIYSTHDTLLAALLNALGVFNMQAPPYGSSIIFELHSENESDHIIKAFYLNETQSENPWPLLLPTCSSMKYCKLGVFLHNTEELVPENWRKECGLPTEDQTPSSGLSECPPPLSLHGEDIKKTEEKHEEL
ncbi:lysosomal acid phosphatase-like protein, partial [Dinothrombium tinctorium]